ncbi:hypothetical protein K474DRAFT_1694075 [Panus rudis PR-1116 ss-1]|nr:hypothetical protein K474DRAFT_1694075 [Panus rudis PR-1116 ss-1]
MNSFWSDLAHRGAVAPSAVDLTSGSSNLRLYAKTAVLPDMQVLEQKDIKVTDQQTTQSNGLNIRWEKRYKTLSFIQTFDGVQFFLGCTQFVERYIPCNDLKVPDADEVTGEQLTIACPGKFSVTPRIIGRSHNMERVLRWVHELPLYTVQRIFHLSFEDSYPWTFEVDNASDSDHNIWRAINWCEAGSNIKADLAVVIQPPWILSLRDLELFQQSKGLPSEHHFASSSRNKAWAKLWDHCNRRDCRYFVVTNYWGWIFGAFSPGWTRAYVSPVIHSANKTPTIVECLTFWLASAMGYDAWITPQAAPEHVPVETSEDIPPPPMHRLSTKLHRSSSILDGGSSVGNLEDSVSVDKEDAIDERVSLDGVNRGNAMLPPNGGSSEVTKTNKRKLLEDWVDNVGPRRRARHHEYTFTDLVTPAPTEPDTQDNASTRGSLLSVSTKLSTITASDEVSTIRESDSDHEDMDGDWLTSDPRESRIDINPLSWINRLLP